MAGPSLLSQLHHLCRAVGLGLPPLLFNLITTRPKHTELRKPVVTKSFRTAALRCGVHVLPTMVSIVAISLNLRHVFLGRTLPGSLDQTMSMALLQIAAKLQEMLIIASLAALVLEVLRYEMMYRGGIPLGLVGSSFQFASLSYFWSPDFWGSFSPKSGFQRRRKILLFGLLSVTGGIATFAGPSTAVLLIPRVQDWQAGGSEFYLPGLSTEIWPDRLTFNPNEHNAVCALPNATSLVACPSSGYDGIRRWMQGMQYSSTTKSGTGGQITNRFNCFQYISFQRSHGSIPDSVMIGNTRSQSCETSFSAPHLATAITQNRVARDWNLAVANYAYNPGHLTLSEFRFWETLRVSTESRIPVVRVACSESVNMSISETTLTLPVMPEGSCWNSFAQAQVFGDDVAPCDHVRTTWTTLPDRFGHVSTGLIIELPWSDGSNSRVVSGCSIDARWANGSVSQSLVFNDISQEFDGGPDFVGGALSMPANNACTDTYGWSTFTPGPTNSWSQIKLDQSWLQVLTPVSPDSAVNSAFPNTTTLEYLLSEILTTNSTGDQIASRMQIFNGQGVAPVNRTVFLEMVVSAIITDGLSRQGCASIFQNAASFSNLTLVKYEAASNFDDQIVRGGHALQKPTDGTDYTPLNATILITGFCFKASAITDFLSIAVLLSHIALALAHTLWLLQTGRSSTCWDTITELIALIQNSRQAPIALENTCAGIRHLRTFSKMAVIRATNAGEDPDHDPGEAHHVELIFLADKTPGLIEQEAPSYNRSSSTQSVRPHIDVTSGEMEEYELGGHGPYLPVALTTNGDEQSRRHKSTSSVSFVGSQHALLGPRDSSGDGSRRRVAFRHSVTERVVVDQVYG